MRGARRDDLRLRELLRRDRRRVDVDPADAEADPGWTHPVGQGEQDLLAVACDDDAVHLGAVDELFEDRLAGHRGGERLVQVAIDVVERVDAEDAALAARVRRLQHGGKPDFGAGTSRLRQRPHRREAGLRNAGVGKPPAHRDLVRHQVRGLDADPGQAARLGDRGDDRDRTVGAHREHAVDLQPRGLLQHLLDVCEVDDLRDVRVLEARSVGVAVDGGDPEAQ